MTKLSKTVAHTILKTFAQEQHMEAFFLTDEEKAKAAELSAEADANILAGAQPA